MGTLDMAEILLDAYHLADQINESEEVQAYLNLRKKLKEDPEAQKLIREFQKLKERYEEAQRFGIFHPNYHESKNQAESFLKQMRAHPVIGSFLEAEEKLDHLLYQVSSMIARSVSESVKVPVNDMGKGSKKGRKACGDR
ncbi:YlbF family regulator [Paenactinomyces guangxiensis]|uniref:YlbF family regulator n=1 Tax=Paenactinomyces guangxiensis TaxID=1490290 RepID=A0A7W1WN64_9BACL|nr:YlbF family regulator [Paenactinomyces guangxiensis]MBA4492915.1 YlbF family regulator [Paenactinomyces guangxiensis]MBH8590236.1 YlbF family regulator [Paenactinomyces guangxiensis]